MKLNLPLNPLSPVVALSHPKKNLRLCSDYDITLLKIYNDVNRGLTDLAWSLSSELPVNENFTT